MKDLFSNHSAEYAKYRPTYSQDLFDYIFSFVKTFDTAWDCATGNGQAALFLAIRFKQVLASDISQNQLSHASQYPNIQYIVAQAEKTPFQNHQFDLITVAQALHWFDFDPFYTELKRVLKPDGVFAAWCYDLCRVNPEIDSIIGHFYHNLIRSYWDERRHYIDEKYETIPFPFKKIVTPSFSINLEWDFHSFCQYFATWSGTQAFIKKEGRNPIELVKDDLKQAWGQPSLKRRVVWPIYLLLTVKNEHVYL